MQNKIEFTGNLTISRVNCSGHENYIEIRIQDDESGAHVVIAKIPLQNFAEAVTGLSVRKCSCTTCGLDHVGKKMEVDQITFPCSNDYSYDERREKATELAKKACPDGWIVSDSFNSRDSFFQKDGEYYAKATIRRWVGKDMEGTWNCECGMVNHTSDPQCENCSKAKPK